jgi:hypothetical protein
MDCGVAFTSGGPLTEREKALVVMRLYSRGGSSRE